MKNLGDKKMIPVVELLGSTILLICILTGFIKITVHWAETVPMHLFLLSQMENRKKAIRRITYPLLPSKLNQDPIFLIT
jgi:hypothetical protein